MHVFQDVGSYLPVEGKTVKHGPFSITTEVMSSDDHCVEYELRLRLAEKVMILVIFVIYKFKGYTHVHRGNLGLGFNNVLKFFYI